MSPYPSQPVNVVNKAVYPDNNADVSVLRPSCNKQSSRVGNSCVAVSRLRGAELTIRVSDGLLSDSLLTTQYDYVNRTLHFRQYGDSATPQK